MRRAWILVLAACGGNAAGVPDARPVDAVTLDAVRCSLPAPVASQPAPSGASMWDVAIRVGGMVVAVLPAADHVLVFTQDAVITASLDGTSVTSAAASGIGTVVAGNGTYGALVVPNRLCVLDATGAYDPSRCVSLGAAAYAGPLAFDGTYYDLYTAHPDGSVTRDSYDATPTLVASSIVSTDWNTGDVWAAARTATTEYLVTEDYTATCARLREHVLQPDGTYVTRDLLPDDAGDGAMLDLATDGDAVSLLYDGACGIDGCVTAPEKTALVTTTSGATTLLARAAVPTLEWWYGHSAARDGDRTVIVGSSHLCTPDGPSCESCEAWASLERIKGDGSIDVSGDVIATAVQSDQLPAKIAVIAPGDYAIAYTGNDGLHLTRVLLP